MTLYETEGGSVLVDAGLAFPRDEHLGVDLVLPDFSYLKDHAADIRAVLLTHAHEDHVGSLPYVLREVPVPRVLRDEADARASSSRSSTSTGSSPRSSSRRSEPEDGPIDVGPFRVDTVRMAHSVPDNVAFVLEAQRPARAAHERLQARPHSGRRLQDGRREARRPRQPRRRPHARRLDERRAARASRGSERLVGEAFRQIIPLRKGRVLIASFASNVHRMQQAIDVALESDRKVCVVGRSMRKNLNIARSLGYLTVAGRHPDPACRAGRLPAGQGARPLHRKPGRAALGAHAHRLQRPFGRARRPRRHSDHLGQARARERAARARHDQPARARRRGDPPPGDRARARVGARQLGGDPHRARARPPARRDARARRVPDAGRAGEDGRRGGRPGCVDRAGRERLRRRADPRPASGSSTTSTRA